MRILAIFLEILQISLISLLIILSTFLMSGLEKWDSVVCISYTGFNNCI